MLIILNIDFKRYRNNQVNQVNIQLHNVSLNYPFKFPTISPIIFLRFIFSVFDLDHQML